MVEFLSDIRPGVFVRRPGIFPDNRKLPGIGGEPLPNGLGSRRDEALSRRGPFGGAQLSDGAKQALRGSEYALELARDFNAARLGRSARRRLDTFFRGFSRDLGASERDIGKTARRIAKLTADLDRRFGDLADRRFGDLADRVFGRLDSDLGGAVRSADFSFSQLEFSLQIDRTVLSVVKDGEESLLRLEKLELSLRAVRVDGSVSAREGISLEPEAPLFDLSEERTAANVADRLIEIFGTSSVSTRFEAQSIELDLSTTVFQAAAGLPADADEETGPSAPDGGVSVVA